jgi:hypothetical protein
LVYGCSTTPWEREDDAARSIKYFANGDEVMVAISEDTEYQILHLGSRRLNIIVIEHSALVELNASRQ